MRKLRVGVRECEVILQTSVVHQASVSPERFVWREWFVMKIIRISRMLTRLGRGGAMPAEVRTVLVLGGGGVGELKT